LVNAKLNTEKTNILPFNYAIAVEPGEYYYNSSEATFDNGGISKQAKSIHGKYQLDNKVTGVNLFDFLKNDIDVSLDQLRFIKIDVEGLDFEVLQSIKDMILEYRPTIIAECFKKLDNDTRYKLFNMFAEADFELFKLDEFNADGQIEKLLVEEDMKKWKHFDFCAIPKERVEDVHINE
jgi:FkbM family methyltransferase